MAGVLDLPFLEVDNAEELTTFLERQGNESITENIAVHDQNVTLLHYVAMQNKPRCTEVLLEKQADVNRRAEQGEEPLHSAACMGAVDSMKILIEWGANLSSLDHRGRTPLECAVSNKQVAAARLLLTNHVNVNGKNARQESLSPLHTVASAGHTELAQLLLDFQADANIMTDSRRSPLHYAAENSHVEIIDTLVRHKADVGATESKGKETALHYAASSGSAATIECLVRHKADLHALTMDRNTPLHKAMQANNAEAIATLIRCGSATSLKNRAGKTAREMGSTVDAQSVFDQAQKELKSAPPRTLSSSVASESAPSSGPGSPLNSLPSRDPALAKESLESLERDTQKNVLHLRSVLQAITKASQDTGSVMQTLTSTHVELVHREGDAGADHQAIHSQRDTLESELKELQTLIQSIASAMNQAQNTLDACLLSSTPAASRCATDEPDSSAQESAGDVMLSLTRSRSQQSSTEDLSKGAKKRSDRKRSKSSREVKSLKRSRSAKKVQIDHRSKGDASPSSQPALERQKSDQMLKDELSRMGKDDLIAMALELKDSETPSPPRQRTSNNKKLKHRIPSKTRLRIAPLTQTSEDTSSA